MSYVNDSENQEEKEEEKEEYFRESEECESFHLCRSERIGRSVKTPKTSFRRKNAVVSETRRCNTCELRGSATGVTFDSAARC